MEMKPYVGITGAVSNEEVRTIIKEFSDAGYTMNSSHIPMLGFLVSYKTLNGQHTENRRYPKFQGLVSLLREANREVLAMVHYNSREMSSLAEQVSKIFEGIYTDNLCHSIQLNIIWPDANQVKLIKERFPEMHIVFQASHKAMTDKTVKEICDGIGGYGDALNYVLIDPSGGKGLEFEIENSVNLYSELRARFPDLVVGFAGGFNGSNVKCKLDNLIGKVGESCFCIDAEGGLRDKISDNYGDDLLNIGKVRDYLQSASSVLR
jgi:hypothetical protein